MKINEKASASPGPVGHSSVCPARGTKMSFEGILEKNSQSKLSKKMGAARTSQDQPGPAGAALATPGSEIDSKSFPGASRCVPVASRCV